MPRPARAPAPDSVQAPPGATESAPPQARTYGGIDLNARKAQRREAFLQAGLNLFGTQGYRQATVRQVCREARLTDRYFYESFETLEDLLLAVYHREFDRLQHALVPALMASLQARRPIDGIRQGLELVFDMVEDQRVARVCWLEVLGVSARVDAEYSHRVEQFAGLLLMATRLHLPQWHPQPQQARLLGQAMIGVVVQIVTQALLQAAPPCKTDRIEAALMVFEGLWMRLQTEVSAPAAIKA